MENECEALPGVAYPGVRDNRRTVNTKPDTMMMMNTICEITKPRHLSGGFMQWPCSFVCLFICPLPRQQSGCCGHIMAEAATCSPSVRLERHTCSIHFDVA